MVTAKRALAIAVGILLTLSGALPAAAANSGSVDVSGSVAGTFQLTISGDVDFGTDIGPDGANGGVYDNSGNTGACYVAAGPSYTIRSNTGWYGKISYTGQNSNYDLKWAHHSYGGSNSVPTGDFDEASFSDCKNGSGTIYQLDIDDNASHTDNWIGSSSSLQNPTAGDTGADEFSLTIEWLDGDDDLSFTITYTVGNV